MPNQGGDQPEVAPHVPHHATSPQELHDAMAPGRDEHGIAFRLMQIRFEFAPQQCIPIL